MYEIDFNKPLHIHFIGIGGISMSGLAEILLKEDFKISGSDAKPSDLVTHLESLGAKVYIGQRASNITDDIELVIYTAAIHPDNPEFACAKEKQIPMLTRAELLGQIMRNYETPIAVSGTHGKTTTTSMISHILLEADADPTISVGGILPAIHGNIRVGESETFVTEACEYTNSFLSFFPKISIILNIDADHLDFFKDIDDIRHSFRLFAERLPKDGTLIINQDIPNVAEITKDLPCGLFPMPWNRMQITLLQILNLMKLHTLPSIVWKKVLYLVIFHFPFLVFTMSQMHCLPLHWEETWSFPGIYPERSPAFWRNKPSFPV